jgi:DNA-binding HxlR family transcriptional regulator
MTTARPDPRIAANILSERLKRWSGTGCWWPGPTPSGRPGPRQLTAEGTGLAGALRLLAHWGARHANPA